MTKTLRFGCEMKFPEEVLANIFSYLPLRDRYNSSLVCKPWAQAMNYPSVWYYTEVRCETGAEDHGLQHFCHLLGMVKHLKIIVCQLKDVANRDMALRVLSQATDQSNRLQKLSVSCMGEFPLFYSGEDILHGIEAVLLNEASGLSLREVDFRDMPFTLSDQLIRNIAQRSPDLQRIYINNQALVCNVTVNTIQQLLVSCPKVQVLGAFYASLSEKVLSELLLPGRAPFKLLELYCERSDKYVPAISNGFWEVLHKRHPSLSVNVILNHTLPAKKFLKILQPSIPIRDLELLTYTYLVNEVNFVAASYGTTLEKLVLQTTSSAELDLALVGLASSCPHLREIHCYCVVTQGVVQAFCTKCPHLWRYTLKTRKEPHPWTCTVIK
ncbi:F-box/LRR-repeat protein 8 isoform X2 [Paramormyrops kingsleyae]|uniref:F-box/LRR-repeat protein 8 isoform X2 n=1 Tax=Paramormyrops kingsleyae TaxID=1676925 RepID=UPI003B974F01